LEAATLTVQWQAQDVDFGRLEGLERADLVAFVVDCHL
jgi:hypothetical protein